MEKTHSAKALKRTILYYPTMSIPTDSWLRQALLYWDEIGSIVPEQLEESGEFAYPADIEFLRKEGEYRPFRPEAFFRAPRKFEELKSLSNEFYSIIDSDAFKRLRTVKSSQPKTRKIQAKHFLLNYRIHEAKLYDEELFSELERRGLVEKDIERRRQKSEWHLFEENTALVYMSLLAKYLASRDRHWTVVGTDHRGYEKLIFDAQSPRKGFACLDIRFLNALPVPRGDVSVSTILRFKRKRKDELNNFTQRLVAFENELSKAEDADMVKEIVYNFRKEIEKSLKELTRQMNEVKMPSVAGSIKSLMSSQSPTLWSGLVVALGIAKTITTLPVSWLVAGTLVAGAITITSSWIDERNKTMAVMAEHPFAFLLHAQTEGLVSA